MPVAVPVKVKVCGITDEAGFDAAITAGADWIGFVFFPPSPRFVTPERAAAIASRNIGGPPRVGLFVDPSDDAIAASLDALTLDILQIYAPAPRVASLRRRFGRPVWRPVGVAQPADLPQNAEGCDALLIEARPPAEATRPGGNARRFDWSILAGWKAPAPWLLGGGLNPGNVAAAIAASGAPAVDVSSGVERRPGRKDPALIGAFVRAAHSPAPPGRLA
ncbi:MAG: phosphoribosylanthranilate isomerase [Acetobacteraceae bacterium]